MVGYRAHRDAAQVAEEGGPRHEELPEEQQGPRVQLGGDREEPEYAAVAGPADVIINHYEAEHDS